MFRESDVSRVDRFLMAVSQPLQASGIERVLTDCDKDRIRARCVLDEMSAIRRLTINGLGGKSMAISANGLESLKATSRPYGCEFGRDLTSSARGLG